MIRYAKAERATWPEGSRRCVSCKKLKPYTDFHKHASCWRGVNTVCIVCRKPSSKEQWSNRSLETRLYHSAKSRAFDRGISFDLELSDIVVPDVCPVFGFGFVAGDQKKAASLDRIDPEKGYVKGNIMVISNLANMMKNSATLDELHQFGKWACEVSF